jgi:hypothetical protein
MSNTNLNLIKRIEKSTYLIRGQKVMLDRDLAELYEVETKTLNRAVKRNLQRFPADFMFQLTVDEAENLRYQFGTSSFTAAGVTSLTFLPSRALRCFRVS